MKIAKPKNLKEFHNLFRSFRSHDGFGHWFRGQSNSSWNLLPKAGRKEYYLPDNRDLGRYNDWRQQAVAYCNLPTSKIEGLAIAQHHGLATRLLDWTMNPLVAAYFCCFENEAIEGAIYILEIPSELIEGDSNFDLIENYIGVLGYIPKSISPRVLNQRGIFTLHCNAKCEIPLKESRFWDEKQNMIKVFIEPSLKKEVLEMLDDYGINRVTLFPDLDGLSMHVNYKTKQIK
ncbi:MAG: FRG domain-containing protein [Desulfobacteraceae bacterium]|nr:FRG domain-containing protein [Desulfobacteraceae bacterium]